VNDQLKASAGFHSLGAEAKGKATLQDAGLNALFDLCTGSQSYGVK
jgi:hypothetical protein